MKKWPGLALPENFMTCFEPTAGVLRVEACVTAYKQLALAAGATLHTNEKVQSIEAGDIVRVQTVNGQYKAKQLIVTAGAWATELLQTMDVSIPVTPTRKPLHGLTQRKACMQRHSFLPIALSSRTALYYGFPNIDGAGLKIGKHMAWW